jgi:hypothetical protein
MLINAIKLNQINMITTKIRIQSLEDAMNGMPAIEGINSPNDYTEVELKTVAILESGLTSGKTSIMFHFETGDGKKYIAQTSANMLRNIAGILQGAEARFEEAKSKR